MVRWKQTAISSFIFLSLVELLVAKKVVLLDTRESTSELRWVTHSISEQADVGWIEETHTDVQEGSNVRAYVVCEVDQSLVDNWLRTPFIEVHLASRVYVEVTFTMRDCREFPGQARSCKETFTLLYHQSDEVVDDNQMNFNERTFKTIERIAADDGRFSTKSDPLRINVETNSINVSKKGIYFAFRDQGACTSILAVKIYYELCEETVNDYAWFPETPTGPASYSIVEVEGRCEPHSTSGTSVPMFLCTAAGTWDLRKDSCKCNAGYWPNEREQKCVACPKGTFKASVGEGVCLECPSSSFALEQGSAVCICDGGYFRSPNDPVGTPCTRPPTRPLQAQVISVDQTSAVITWQPPSSKGGRNELWYRVECKECPGSTQYTPGSRTLNTTQITLTGLQPSSIYPIFIYAENDISTQVEQIMYSVIEVETIKLAPLHVDNLQVASKSDTRVLLTWDPPEVPLEYHETANKYPTPSTVEDASPARAIGMEPANRPNPIQHYQVRYYAKNLHQKTEMKTVVKTQAAFEGLKPNSDYGFQVRAYTTRGWGAWSPAVWTSTNEAGNAETTYTDDTDDSQSNSRLTTILFAILAAVIILLVVGIVVCFVFKRGRPAKKQPSDLDVLEYKNELDTRLTPDYNHLVTNGTLGYNKLSSPLMNPFIPIHPPLGYAGFKPYVDPTTYEDPNAALRDFTNEVDARNIVIEHIIGKGEFGEVCMGRLKGFSGRHPDEYQMVAIKSLDPQTVSEKSKADFLAEASIMGQFDHPNVIRLIGVVTKVDPTMIITEYMEHRSLDSFLRNNESDLEFGQLVHMLRGIAAGMKYLSDKGYLHRDLAARNVLVSKEFVCKIADFGLSREGEGSVEQVYTTKGGKIPVRWTAPEAITYRKFTTASDVWSFGIVMWEVASYGERPYYDWTNQDVIQKIEQGFRLPAPMGCPPGLHQLMLECWHGDRFQRPSFSHILQRIDAFLKFPELLNTITDGSTTSSICPVDSVSSVASLQPLSNGVLPAAFALDDFLDSIGLSHCSRCLQQHGVRSLDALARLSLVDYLNYGLEQQEANRIREALINIQAATLPRRMANGRLLAASPNGYHHTMATLQPQVRRQQHQNEGFFV